jgi:hypothetical protein
MAEWLAGSHRKPLVLRGARQVGKTTLVREFARAAGLTLCEVNLERHREWSGVFASMDPVAICERLGAHLGRDVRAEGSLLFLDEIQAIPEALASLRYFLEEMPRLPVVAAGSLLEFTLARHSFSMPVGRIEYLHLGPMDFVEFLEAANPYLAERMTMESVCAEGGFALHGEAMKWVRTYLLTGGMPEAVARWIETRSLAAVAAVQEEILGTYVDDFAKYAGGRDLAALQGVFRRLPAQAGRKVKYVNFSREMKSREVKSALDLFAKARLITPVRHSGANGIPLGAEENREVWKPLFLDVGLMNHANGIGEAEIASLADAELVNEGALAEQFAGQQLLFRGGGRTEPVLHYWLREGGKGNAEVDYVLQCGRDVVPVEVKAGKTGSLRALRRMMEEKKLPRAVRFDAGPWSVQRIPRADGLGDWELTTLPLYAAAFAFSGGADGRHGA